MRMIMAIIRPFKLEAVREALAEIGIEGMTVSEVKGYGRQMGQKEIYRGAEYQLNFVPKVKIEVVFERKLEDRVIDAVRMAANENKIGDGKIFVLDVRNTVRIRTGETGIEAL